MYKLQALIKKEFYQIVRDPSSILIAVVLPIILLIIYGYGVSLDANNIRIGLVVEDDTPIARTFKETLSNSRYFTVIESKRRQDIENKLIKGDIRGFVVIPNDFSKRLYNSYDLAPIQVIADGSETNTANFVQNYIGGVWQVWVKQQNISNATNYSSPVNITSRFWFNPELKSRNFLLPGSVALIMTLIGTLLTALVVAREWERGTMEAMMSTPVTMTEIILGKLIPYFLLGIISMVICVCVSIFHFSIPFRGSFLILSLASSVFLVISLEQGLLISILSKNQFVASQLALLTAFLPSYMLSGFIFEISSMPIWLQFFTYFIPARYFIKCLLSLFLAGNVMEIILPNVFAMLVMASALFLVITFIAKKRLS